MKFTDRKYILTIILLNFIIFHAKASNDIIEMNLDTWSAEINLKSLEVTAKTEQNTLSLASPISHLLSEYKNLKSNSTSIKWDYPEKNLSVEVKKES